MERVHVVFDFHQQHQPLHSVGWNCDLKRPDQYFMLYAVFAALSASAIVFVILFCVHREPLWNPLQQEL